MRLLHRACTDNDCAGSELPDVVADLFDVVLDRVEGDMTEVYGKQTIHATGGRESPVHKTSSFASTVSNAKTGSFTSAASHAAAGGAGAGAGAGAGSLSGHTSRHSSTSQTNAADVILEQAKKVKLSPGAAVVRDILTLLCVH